MTLLQCTTTWRRSSPGRHSQGWLLFAGPLQQATLQLQDEQVDRDELARAQARADAPAKASAWRWLVPPRARYEWPAVVFWLIVAVCLSLSAARTVAGVRRRRHLLRRTQENPDGPI